MATRKRNKPDYSQVESDLIALERRLQHELEERLDNVQNTSLDHPAELLDLAAEGEIDFMSAISAQAGSATIDEIQQARRKIKEGSYGVCEACQRAIRKRRLKARPFAVLCIQCKESEERLGYMGGPTAVPARGNSGITVSLTDEDGMANETSARDVFRDVEDMEISDRF